MNRPDERITSAAGMAGTNERDRRIKVFYLITGLYVGGAEKAFLELTRCLDRERYEPVVCAVVGGELFPEFEKIGVRTYDLGMRYKWDVRAFFRLLRVLRKERPDVLHTRLLRADQLGRVAGRLCGVPVIVSTVPMVEDIRRRWFWRTLDHWTAQLNDSIIVLSTLVKNELIKVERLNPAVFEVIPNGIRSRGPVDPPHRERIRRELGVPEDALLVGVISRLETPRKGHHILLQSFHDLMERHPKLYGVIIGRGPGQAQLEQQARDLGLADRVFFVGQQMDVQAWLSALDVFTLPSLLEGFPMAIVEALEAGSCIVATATAGVPDLILHEETGLLAPPGEVQPLTSALDRVLSDPELAQRLREGARRHFEARFDMDVVARRIEAVYEKHLTRRGVSGAAASESTTDSPERPLRLLEVVTALDTGGVTTYLMQLQRHLSSSSGVPAGAPRFEVEFASGPEQFEPSVVTQMGVPHHMIPALTKRIAPLEDLKALRHLCRIIRSGRYDVVHTHMAKADWLGGLAARLCGVPRVVSTAHGATQLTPNWSTQQAMFDVIERLTFRCLAHQVISVSGRTTAHLVHKRAAQRRKVVTIVNGVEMPREMHVEELEHRRAAIRASMRRELSLTPEQPVLVMVGRLAEPKTPEVLIRSVQRLRAQWPDLVCLLVGNGPNRDALASWIRTEGLESAVRLLGNRDDVRDVLCAADVFVLSSSSEGMPMSVLEAMAAGLPVVASRVGGVEELVADRRTGLLVPPGNVDACADAIHRLLEDPACRAHMGHAALQRVEESFNINTQMAKTVQTLSRARAGAALRRVPLWERLAVYHREHGLRGVFRRLVERIIRPFYQREEVWFFKRLVDDPMPHLAAGDKFSVRRAAAEDFDRFLQMGFFEHQELREFFDTPEEVCFLAEHDGDIIAYQWARLGPGEACAAGSREPIPLGPDEAFFHHARTMHAYRAKGVIPVVEEILFRWLAEHGYRTCYTEIACDNTPSIKTFEKLGFRKHRRASLRRIGPWTSVKYEQLRIQEPAPARILLVHGGENDGMASALASSLNADVCEVRPAGMLRGWAMLGAVLKLARRLRHASYDVVHCSDRMGLLVGGLAAFLAGAVHVTTFVQEPSEADRRKPSSICGVSYSRLLHGVEAILTPSERVREELEREGIDASRVHLINEQVDMSVYNGHASKEDALTRLGVAVEGPMIGTIMSMEYDMDPWSFLTLCQWVTEAIPEARFLMAGDGSLFMTLKRHAKQMGLKNVVFLRNGFVNRDVLKALDVFVHVPGSQELRMPAFEALASAKPVVLLRSAEEREHATTPARHAQAIQAAQQEVLELLQHPELREEKGREALSDVSKNFSVRHVALQHEAVWNELMANDLVPARPRAASQSSEPGAPDGDDSTVS